MNKQKENKGWWMEGFKERFFEEHIDSEWGGSGYLDWADKDGQSDMLDFISYVESETVRRCVERVRGRKQEGVSGFTRNEYVNDLLEDIARELEKYVPFFYYCSDCKTVVPWIDYKCKHCGRDIARELEGDKE